MPLPRPLLVALLAATLPLAGCIGETPAPGLPEDEVNTTSAPNVTLPDGRGVCGGCAEVNKTEEGVGGVDHKHDYWKGRETVDLLLERRTYLGPTPVYPDGEGTSAKSVAYVKLPCTPLEDGSEGCEPALVYEGAEKVLVTLANPRLAGAERLVASAPQLAMPNPPNMFLQYRSAADSDWREPIPVTYGTPVEILVEAHETDMPHSVRSLWVFRLTTDQSADMYVDMTVTAVKGREVVDWPGHPDFYADTDARVVMRQHVKTHMSGIVGGYLYDSGGTWATPEKLISHGTGKLIVIANVTSARSQTGQAPTGFFLETHNATFIGPEIRFGARWFDRDDTNDLQSYDFEVPVDVQGMDGPYQPHSRWGFRLMATFADIDAAGIGLCPGCFDYEIEYDIVVIALKAEGEQAAMG